MEEFLNANQWVKNKPANVQIEEYHKWMALKEQQNQQIKKELEQQSILNTASQLTNKIGKKTDIAIGERNYTICHWSPTKVHRNIPKIGKYFVVPVSTIVGEVLNARPDVLDDEGNIIETGSAPDFSEAIPTCLQYLFYTMEENDIIEFYKIILEDVYFDGKPVMQDFDNVFDGYSFDIIGLVAEVIKVNYVIPFSQKGGLSSLNSLLNVARPMMEVANI